MSSLSTGEALDRLVAWFQALEPASVQDMDKYYVAEAYFKDPFNEVHRREDLERIFRHMFEKLEEPRFRVTGRVLQGDEAVLIWDMLFRFRGSAQTQTIHGASHLRFAPDGRVAWHRDYWDAAEELYERLPVLGALMRWLKRRAGS